MKKQTKKAQKEVVQAILHKYDIGSEVDIIEDVEHLLDLFTRHPEWVIKEGAGVRRILVRLSEYKNRCFYLERIDGSVTDISFIQCIDGRSSKLSDVRCACRSAIRPVIEAYRADHVVFGQTLCPVTGEVLMPDNTQIDHYDQTFQNVFAKWVKLYNVDWLYTQLNDMMVDGETGIYFINPVLVAGFVAYHDANTHLRAVSKIANLSLLRKG